MQLPIASTAFVAEALEKHGYTSRPYTPEPPPTPPKSLWKIALDILGGASAAPQIGTKSIELTRSGEHPDIDLGSGYSTAGLDKIYYDPNDGNINLHIYVDCTTMQIGVCSIWVKLPASEFIYKLEAAVAYAQRPNEPAVFSWLGWMRNKPPERKR